MNVCDERTFMMPTRSECLIEPERQNLTMIEFELGSATKIEALFTRLISWCLFVNGDFSVLPRRQTDKAQFFYAIWRLAQRRFSKPDDVTKRHKKVGFFIVFHCSRIES